MTTSPWKTGAALASTIAVAYPVCAVLVVLFPDRSIEFLNTVFHGLDFAKLKTPATFSLSPFYFPFIVLVVWGFAVGTLFAWLRDLFGGGATPTA